MTRIAVNSEVLIIIIMTGYFCILLLEVSFGRQIAMEKEVVKKMSDRSHLSSRRQTAWE